MLQHRSGPQSSRAPKTLSTIKDNYFIKRKSKSLEDARQPREAIF